jgi:hypothetical protein
MQCSDAPIYAYAKIKICCTGHEVPNSMHSPVRGEDLHLSWFAYRAPTTTIPIAPSNPVIPRGLLEFPPLVCKLAFGCVLVEEPVFWAWSAGTTVTLVTVVGEPLAKVVVYTIDWVTERLVVGAFEVLTTSVDGTVKMLEEFSTVKVCLVVAELEEIVEASCPEGPDADGDGPSEEDGVTEDEGDTFVEEGRPPEEGGVPDGLETDGEPEAVLKSESGNEELLGREKFCGIGYGGKEM